MPAPPPWIPPALAQDATGAQTGAQTDAGAAEQRLEGLADALRRNEEHAARLKSEIDEIAQDRSKLRRRLIETAERIKASEEQIGQAELRLERLADRQRIVRGSLVERRHLLAELLAALQKIGRAPPPAIVVQPRDALTAIRSAMLLGIIVPELREEAQKLAADLAELTELAQSIDQERTSLAGRTASLAEERVRIEALIESRQSSLQATREHFEEARRRGEELARETQSLRDLIRRMDEAVGDVASLPEALPPLDPRQARAALSDPGRMRPAVAFPDAKGMLSLPASGVLTRHFGDDDEQGTAARGISIATRAQAQVTSPCDGWIVYAGSFRSYGELLIINAGGGYHVVLAGLERVSAHLGQFVLAGEPVGAMGAGNGSRLYRQASEQDNQPVLYVEFRKDGTSIDPSPWWASAEERVRG